jgi:hypothetical protein
MKTDLLGWIVLGKKNALPKKMIAAGYCNQALCQNATNKVIIVQPRTLPS